MKIVLARSYRDYRYWLVDNKMSERDARYVSRNEQLYGLELSPDDVIDLGGSTIDRTLLATRIRKPR